MTTDEQTDAIISPKPERMNGKPVLYRDAKTVLTRKAEEFKKKGLCDGLTLNPGDACAFGCTYCYVSTQMLKLDKPVLNAYTACSGVKVNHSDVVIRRKNAVAILNSQLLRPDGSNLHDDPEDNRVVFMSTLVDVTANKELLEETAELCLAILRHTHFQIRLLSKSALLAQLITGDLIPAEFHPRLIFGFSIGTLDDPISRAIEVGTSSPSARLKALHQLQDRGIRTYGMICPSLPQDDYADFSRKICDAIRVDRCEHVWAEVINDRGQSLNDTVKALRVAGFEHEARKLEAVSGSANKQAWEEYARQTFNAHAQNVPPGKLRFLQYVSKGTLDWWMDREIHGAVLLGSIAEGRNHASAAKPAGAPNAPPLSAEDIRFLEQREEIIGTAIRASIAAAKALFEIHSYREGKLWKNEFATFERYCQAKWSFQKSHAYRLVDAGRFMADWDAHSPQGESVPANCGQLRPFLDLVPKEHQVACWNQITRDKNPATLSSPVVAAEVRKYLDENGINARNSKTGAPPPHDPLRIAKRNIDKLRVLLGKLPNAKAFEHLLVALQKLIDQENRETHSAAPQTAATLAS